LIAGGAAKPPCAGTFASARRSRAPEEGVYAYGAYRRRRVYGALLGKARKAYVGSRKKGRRQRK